MFPERFSGNHSFLVNTLLLYILLFTLTDRITDRETHTLAVRGLEELFFQLCCCVSFWFWWGIGFGFTYLCTQITIQLWCCVSFLVLAGNSFSCYIRTQCTIQLCGCVSFLVVVGNRSQNENTFLQKHLIGLVFVIRQPICVFYMA